MKLRPKYSHSAFGDALIHRLFPAHPKCRNFSYFTCIFLEPIPTNQFGQCTKAQKISEISKHNLGGNHCAIAMVAVLLCHTLCGSKKSFENFQQLQCWTVTTWKSYMTLCFHRSGHSCNKWHFFLAISWPPIPNVTFYRLWTVTGKDILNPNFAFK